MNKEGILLSDLKKMLIENNVIFKPLDNYEVYTNLFVNNNDKYIGEFKKLIKTFLGLFKSNGYTSKNFNDLRELILKNDSAFLKQRALVFMDIMEPLFDYYTNYLEINRKIDFNDMINMATDIVKGKSVSLDYDYIIIDEYQDISMSRFNLIKEIKNQTNAKVIAVGDDWQSIYRFAGSDINLFTDFEKYYQVWGVDITYLPLRKGFLYLFVIIDWYTREVVDYEMSYSLEKGFVLRCLERALAHRQPEIINSDQGSHFTCQAYLDLLASWGIRVSMNGKGRALDNARTERFFRSLKYDDIYINEYVTPREMIKGVNNYMSTYNTIRPHASLGGLSPQAFKATHMQKAAA
jgi:hypothetical protein